MTQEITKIRLPDDLLTEISLTEDDDNNRRVKKNIEFSSKEQRHGDFTTAFKEVTPFALDYFGYPKKMEKDFELRSITLKNNDTRGQGVMFSFFKTYSGVNGGSSITTPMIDEDLNESGTNKMSEEIAEFVEKIIIEAQEFLKGKRAQGELPLDNQKQMD